MIPCRMDLEQFDNRILDRFCDEILPKIRDKIHCLVVESSFMDRILSTNYSNLNGLALYDLASETARDLFTGKIFSLTLSMTTYMRILK
jgi:hypothetical protein